MGSFSEGESLVTPRKIALGLGGIALLALVAIGGPMVLGKKGEGSTNTPEQMEAQLEANPHIGDAIRAFRTHYPQEYQDYLQRVADATNGRDAAATERQGLSYMRHFLAIKLEAIASAPAADLQQLASARLEVVRALGRSDVPSCARIVTTGYTTGDRPSAEVQALVGRVSALEIQAAKHGESSDKVTRGFLSDSDGQAWYARMRLIDRQATDQMQSGSIRSATPDAQCHAAQVQYQAATELPAELSANATAQLIRHR